MLHHAFGEVNGKKGVWGHAIGGMGAITQAMARAARDRGVVIETDAGVREIIVERDRAVGVVLENGTAIRAKYAATSCFTRGWSRPTLFLRTSSPASGTGRTAPAPSA